MPVTSRSRSVPAFWRNGLLQSICVPFASKTPSLLRTVQIPDARHTPSVRNTFASALKYVAPAMSKTPSLPCMRKCRPASQNEAALEAVRSTPPSTISTTEVDVHELPVERFILVPPSTIVPPFVAVKK